MGDLTRHFSHYECECSCCKEMRTTMVFLNRMDMVRDLYAKPISPSSVYRCSNYNQQVAKSGLSGPHTSAAMDIPCVGEQATELIKIALFMEFKGIGVYQSGDHHKRFIHLDDKERGMDYTTIWSN